MTGPEHYQQAEMILTQVKNGHTPDGITIDSGNVAVFLARAQVHATLAQAAATGLSNTTSAIAEWTQIAGERAW